MQPLSVVQIIAFTARFSVKNIVPILLRVVLPALAGWAILYFSFNAYISELIRYLGAPVIAWEFGAWPATAGLMAALFFMRHCLCHSALALGHKDDNGWIYLRAARREWRLYAAFACSSGRLRSLLRFNS